MTPDVDAARLGQAIRERREALNLTPYRLAKRIGMSDVYLRDMEEGRGKRPGVGVVVRIAHGLGISTDELLRDAGMETALMRPAETVTLFGLDEPARRLAAQMGRALLEMQESYEARLAEALPRAAYHNEEEARQAREDAEGWPDSE